MKVIDFNLTKQIGAERGSMVVFFAAFLLPVMLLLYSAVMDLEMYTRKRAELQSLVDSAAIYASRYLPDRKAAEKAAGFFLSDKLEDVTLEVLPTSDTIGILLSGKFHPVIGNFFERIVGAELSIPLNVTSETRSNPFDVYVAVDRGKALAPDLSMNDLNSWGDADEWGAAQVFLQRLSIHFPGGIIDSRIATQQCFNPLFSSIKNAAIKILDFTGSFSMNRVGVSFFPGASSVVGRTRTIESTTRGKDSVSFYDTHPDWDIDHYVSVTEFEDLVSFPVQSAYCASAAENELLYGNYHVPTGLSFLSNQITSENLIDQSSWSPNPNYPLTSREVIWSRSVSQSQNMDFGVVLNDIERSLFGSGSLVTRAGLVNRTTQLAFVLTHGLPIIGSERFSQAGDAASRYIHSEFDRIRSFKKKNTTKLTLYYFMFGGTASDAERLSLFFHEELLVGSDGKVLFEPRVIRSENIETLLNNVLTSVILENRSSVVSK